MDKKTIDRYNLRAKFMIPKYNDIFPKRQYELIHQFFHENGKTLDIGCGPGRDVQYLNSQGIQTDGLEIAQEFLRHCRETFPHYLFIEDSMPKLEKIATNTYDNLHLSASLMHVPEAQIPETLENLARVCKSEGIIFILYRNSNTETNREEDGRLFEPIPTEWLKSQMMRQGCQRVHFELMPDSTIPNCVWRVCIFKNRPK